jgi:CheY-like chemotaxis protein
VSLVLADIVMPRMGGQPLANALAAREPVIPIVFMSGYTGSEAVRQGLITHGAELLAKPFTPEALLRCVRATLDRRKMVPRS